MRLSLSSFELLFLYLHIFTISWSGVLRINDWMPLPLIFLVLAVLMILTRNFLQISVNRRVPIEFYKIDYLIVIAFLLMCLNVIFNPTPKSANYLLAYGVVFGLYLIFATTGLNKTTTDKILKYSYWGINFICIFVIIEVSGRSAGFLDVFEWIPRTKDATAKAVSGENYPSFQGVAFFRGYGLSTEPTQVGNYLACFAPYAIFYRAHILGKKIVLYTVFLATAAMMTFSAALAAVILTAVLIWLIVTKRKIIMIRSAILFGLVLAFGFSLIIYFTGVGDLLYAAYDKVSSKLLLTGGGTSLNQRMANIEYGLGLIIDNPILGAGLGYMSSLGRDSSINWYLFLASEAGIFILSIFTFWFSFHFISAVLNYHKTKNELFLYVAISIYGGMAYLFFLSTFQNLYLLTSILFYRIILKTVAGSKIGR